MATTKKTPAKPVKSSVKAKNPVPPKFTHRELCELAVKWLKRSPSANGGGCHIAISETVNYNNAEIPDALGWHAHNGSILIEVKISRADFLADASKPHRVHPETGMGSFRYYMVPEGLIKVEELPPQWGLLEVNSRGHIKARAGYVFDFNSQGWRASLTTWRFADFNYMAELATLTLVLNRVGDIQALQDRIREVNRMNTSLANRLQKAEAEVKRLGLELFNAKHKDYRP